MKSNGKSISGAWPEIPFGDIFEISSSKRVLEAQWKDAGVPFYRAREIVKLAKEGTVQNELFISEELYREYQAKYGVPKVGDLMVSGVGTLGACYAVKPGDRFYYKDASVLRFSPKQPVCSRFIQHAFHTRQILDQVHAGSGSTVGTYTISRANETRIPLPPLAEQKRIAGILDAADSLRHKRRESLAQLDSLLQSTFLTLFGGPFDGNPSASHVPFEDLTTRITYGFTSPMSHLSDGIPILTAKNVQDGFIDFEKVHFADQSEFDALTEKSKPSSGDILITKDGSIGRCAVVPDCGPVCINQSVALIIPNRSIVTPDYVSAYIRSAPVQQRIQRMGKGNALKHLQITELAKFPAVIPPLPLQRRFAAIVESVERQKARQRAHLAELDALFAALQHRAFRGEL